MIVFLTENYIDIRHVSSLGLGSGGSLYNAQRTLENMVMMFDEYLKEEGKNHLDIEYVCLFGLSILGHLTRSFCLNRPYTLPYKTKYITSERFLIFLNKLVYVNVNMNERIITTLGGNKYEDTTGVTVFAESVNQIRRLSLLVFAFHKMTILFVLDPTHSPKFNIQNP
jgi:hypothetical protein